MPTKLGNNLDAILNQFEKQQQEREKTDGNNIRIFPDLSPEIVAKLNQIDSELQSTIVDIEWWGYYSTNPTLLREALEFYQKYWDILEPRFTAYHFLREEDIDPSLVAHFSLPYVEAIVSYTERWNSMSEEEKDRVIEKSKWTIEDWKVNSDKAQRKWELAHGIGSRIGQ